MGVEVKVNSRVASYDPTVPSLTLESAETHTADLIVGADGMTATMLKRRYETDQRYTGLKSKARATILKEHDKNAIATGFASYRATVDVEKIRADPEISELVEKPNLNLW